LETTILFAIAVFAGTTITFFVLYRKVKADIDKRVLTPESGKLDEGAFIKLEEILSKSQKEDLRKLLSELKNLRLEAEKLIEGARREAED